MKFEEIVDVLLTNFDESTYVNLHFFIRRWNSNTILHFVENVHVIIVVFRYFLVLFDILWDSLFWLFILDFIVLIIFKISNFFIILVQMSLKINGLKRFIFKDVPWCSNFSKKEVILEFGVGRIVLGIILRNLHWLFKHLINDLWFDIGLLATDGLTHMIIEKGFNIRG